MTSLGPARYVIPLPLPLQGMKVNENEEDITHAPNGVSRWLFFWLFEHHFNLKYFVFTSKLEGGPLIKIFLPQNF